MRYYRTFIFLIVLASLFITGCARIVTKQIQEAPVQNWLYLHANPKKGDYALFESFDKSLVMKMEVVGKDPETVEVAVSWPKVPEAASFLEQSSYHFFVSANGKVQYAHLVDTSGMLKPLRIAQPGDFNYIAPMKTTSLPAPETITTRAGSFQIKDVYVFSQNIARAGAQGKVTSVFFIDPEVHFGLVREAHVNERKLTVPDVLDFIKKSTRKKPSESLTNFITSRSKSPKYMSGMDLVETN